MNIFEHYFLSTESGFPGVKLFGQGLYEAFVFPNLEEKIPVKDAHFHALNISQFPSKHF